MTTRLLNVNRDYLVRFMSENPLPRFSAVRRGDAGDLRTPVPVLEVALGSLVGSGGVLFTQKGLVELCRERFGDWLSGLGQQQLAGIEQKIKNNFYWGFIDTVDAWSVMQLSDGIFDSCYVDAEDDVTVDSDLTVIRCGAKTNIALCGVQTKAGVRMRAYKKKYRTARAGGSIEVWIPLSREKRYGRRWYQISDFKGALTIAIPPVDENENTGRG